MQQFCHSCSMPLAQESRRRDTPYCIHCTDEEGGLRSRETVQQGIAYWLKSWQGDLSDGEATRRADHFMMAMPAWAQE